MIDDTLQKHDLATPTRHRRVRWTITVGRSETDCAAEIAVLDDQLHVRVVEQQIVISERGCVGAVQGRVSSLLEVPEWKAVQLTRYLVRGKERPNEILGAVGGAGIAD